MKNEQDREQLQRYFGQGNNSDPLKNSNRPKRSEDLSFDRTQWFVSEDGQDEDDFEREEPQPQEDFLPNGGKKKKRRQSRLSRFAQSFVLICVFVGAAIFLAYFALISASDLLGLGQPDQQIEVTLTEEQASSLSKTAQVLKDKGVISGKLVFELYGKLKDKEGSFLAKTFVLNNKWGYDQIMDHLAYDKVESDIVSVTFREGMTQRQIGELLEENKVCTADEFYQALDEGDYSTYDFAGLVPDDESLRFRKYEGYIFPDTYEFYEGMPAATAINKLLEVFHYRMTAEMLEWQEESGYTMRQIVTIASMIEKEAANDTEQYTIASVIYNRLNKDWPLQIDSTTLYEYPDHEGAPTAEMLAKDSPYNTRISKGLPPSPICNPGITSIRAALQPSSTNYMYYALNTATGQHEFFTNADAFNAFVATQNYD